MKILPNTIEEINVNDSVKKEYVFKNEQETTSNGVDSNELGSIMPTISEPTNKPVLIVNKTQSNDYLTIVERKDLESTVIHSPPHELSYDKIEDKKPIDVTVFTNDIDNLSESAKYQNFTNSGILRGSVLEPFHFNDDDEEEDIDSSNEVEPTTADAVTPKYFSEQKSLTSKTLQHGFIMNPGC